MTVLRFRARHDMPASTLATSRANRDGITDIGTNEDQHRQRAAEKLEDALRVYRTFYGSPALAELLQCKLDAEQRLINRELSSPPQILSAFRTIESLLKSAADALGEARNLASRTKRAGWYANNIGQEIGSLDDEIRAAIARLETEVRP